MNKVTESEQAVYNEFVIGRTFKGTAPCRSHLNCCFRKSPEVGRGRKTKANEALCLEENLAQVKICVRFVLKGKEITTVSNKCLFSSYCSRVSRSMIYNYFLDFSIICAYMYIYACV